MGPLGTEESLTTPKGKLSIKNVTFPGTHSAPMVCQVDKSSITVLCLYYFITKNEEKMIRDQIIF